MRPVATSTERRTGDLDVVLNRSARDGPPLPLPRWDGSPSGLDQRGHSRLLREVHGYIDEAGKLHVSFGYFSNWRFPIAKALIEDVTLAELFRTEDQSLARSFMLFLHEQGRLTEFVRRLYRDGHRAEPADILQEVLDRSLSQIETAWKSWVAGQPIDAQVGLVPASFIKTNEEWNAWWEENRDRLEWNESRGTYVAKEGV